MGTLHGPLAGLRKLVSLHSRQVLFGFISIAAFIAIWAFVSWYMQDTASGLSPLVPPPRSVAEAFFDSFSYLPGLEGYTMWDLIQSSLGRVLVGFLVAFALAFPIGLLMGSFLPAEYLGRPLLEMFRPIPPLAWVPIFLIAFLPFWGPVAIVFLGAFFPILINTMFGVKSVDPTLTDAARTLGAKKADIFFKVVMPSTIPYMMTGVKIGMGVAWMCIVAAEFIGGKGGTGLGYWITLSSFSYSAYSYTYAAMIMIGILSVLTTGVASLIEQRFYRWSGMK